MDTGINMKSDGLLKEFIRHVRVERGLSPRTWESYACQIKGYIGFLESRRRTPHTTTREFVTAYLEKLKERGLKGASVFATAISIRMFYRFLLERSYVSNDPTAGMRLPKFRQRLPEPLSVSAIEKLLSIPTGSKFNRIRFRAMLELLYATGLRISELISLKIDQVNLDERWVRVIGKGGKERIVPFGPKAQEALLLYVDVRRNRFSLAQDTLFLNSRGQGLTRGGFWWELKQMAGRVGVTGRVTPHAVRHGCATHMIERGADIRVIQAYLGHQSITTTQRYTHVNSELLRSVCKKTHPRF